MALENNNRMPWKPLATGGVAIILGIIAFLGSRVYVIENIQSARGGAIARIQPMEDAIRGLEKDAAVLRQKMDENEKTLLRVYETLRQMTRLP